MEKFIGTKEILAKPMTLGEYNEYRGWKVVPKDQDPDEEGYLVEYLEGGKPNHPDHSGYISWSPKTVFEGAYKNIEKTIPLISVFPTNEISIMAVNDDSDYGGAHLYVVKNCVRFVDGNTKYEGGQQFIQFVKKLEDGTIVPGLQSEQLLIILIDRLQKLNKKFPSRENSIQITKLQEALMWQESRVRNRIYRGVMGELKK